MKDITRKYINMIENFDYDFFLAGQDDVDFGLDELQEQIEEETNLRLLKDLELFREFAACLKYDKIKIMLMK